MKLAISTLHQLYSPLEDVLSNLVSIGTRHIEIADSGNHALNTRRVAKLQDLKASYNIEFSIHAPYADTNLSADDDLIREWVLKRIRASIRFANELDAQALVIHPGWKTAVDAFMPGRAWELNMRSIRWLLKYAEEYGVSCLMENVPEPTPYLLIGVEDFELFYKEIEMNINMVLDVGHAHLRNENYNFLNRFKNKIKHIHVSDNNGTRDQHLPIGDGSINWEKIISKIKSIGFSGWIVIESYHDVQKSLEYLKKYL